jgi:DNA polymerase-3 subunit epsilon
MASHLERTHLLEALLGGVKEAVASLPQGAGDALRDWPRRPSRRKRRTDTGWWPMENLVAEDLGAALEARLSRKGIALACDLGPIVLRCDGFAVTRLLERLALDWTGDGVGELTLTLAAEGGEEAVLSLEGRGDVADPAAVAGWLATPLSPGMTGFTGAAVCTAHGMSVSSEPAGPGRAALRFALPLARPDKTRPSRAVLYDFDLLNADIPEDLAAAKLKDLSFVVFDTETTGLNPQVDEVCQIAAVRVVNGKLLNAERFDMLVNPGRKIPAASTAVHHITDEMVADAPDVAEAMARFTPSRTAAFSWPITRLSTWPSCDAGNARSGAVSTSRSSTPSCVRRSSSGNRRNTRWTRSATGSASRSPRRTATPPSATRSARRTRSAR